jgi:carbon-monoxide dehydrogenase medium subunit
MKPGRFAYRAPTELDEALALLADHGDEAKVLAGGQSLMPMLNFRLAMPEYLIDINRLPGLDSVQRTQRGWRIPALVRQRTLERTADVTDAVPLVLDALRQVAHPQIRNRGTVCGSLTHGDAAAELPTVMTALDATMTIVSKQSIRSVPAEEFFLFHMTTAVEDGELLLDVSFDQPPANTFHSFQEFATRRGDFGLAAVAVLLTFDEDDLITRVRLVAAGVAPTPLRLPGAEALLLGRRVDSALLAQLESIVRGEVAPTGDVHADEAYRRQLAGVLAKRGVVEAHTKRMATHD